VLQVRHPRGIGRLPRQGLELGGADEGAPGERGPGFYNAYFRDLDGNKFCLFKIG
jgi:hypothetical protein